MTTAAYGYRSSEVSLPDVPEIKDGTVLKLFSGKSTKSRPVERSSLGCHVLGASRPHPDHSDVETTLDGACRRFCRKPPSPDPKKMIRFNEFVMKWLHKYMVPLSFDVDVSFETYILGVKCPKWRKEVLRKIWVESENYITPLNIYNKDGVINRYCRVNSFQKDEVYPVYKAARGINSRTDEFKVRVGPIFKLIEKSLFDMPFFIKHTPVDERAEQIKRELYQHASNIIGTDYTSFESLFTAELMNICEFQLYRYMSQNLEDTEWINIVTKVLSGMNFCDFRDKFTIGVPATRMSGEMCTSLGNSFTNLMAMEFIASEIGMSSLRSRIEGDDGIFTFYGPIPSAKDFADLGLIIKIEEYDELTEGSFCGIIADKDDMINVTNPINVILDFGWTSKDYFRSKNKKKLELLKAKSLSYAYQYPGCPIISSLAKYGLRVSADAHFNLNAMNNYQQEVFHAMHSKFSNKVPSKDVGFNTRLLVERRFGVSVEDQIFIEQYLDNKIDLSPLECQAILSNCPWEAFDYNDKYVVDIQDLNHVDFPFEDSYSLAKNNSIFTLFYKNVQECKKSTTPSFGKKKGTTWRKATNDERNHCCPSTC